MPTSREIDANIPLATLSISDMHVIRDHFPAWQTQRHKAFKEQLESQNISIDVWNKTWKRVAEGLGLDGPGDVLRSAGEPHPHESPARVIFDCVCGLLRSLDEAVTRAIHKRAKVLIEGSEIGILWLLPRVLSKQFKSGWLQEFPDVDPVINQTRWSEYIPKLAKSNLDLCIGPDCDVGTDIVKEPVLTIRRDLIYSKDGVQPPPGDLKDLSPLRDMTVFALAGDQGPNYHVNLMLPDPVPPGRRIYVDSIAHMYQYVRQGIGVAVGYHPYFGHIDRQDSNIKTARILDPDLQPVRIILFHRRGAPFSKATTALADEIRRVSREIQEIICP